MFEKLNELFEECSEKRYQESLLVEPGMIFLGEETNPYEIRHSQFLKKLETHQFGKTTKSGENLDAIHLYGLSVEEASIIYMYTHQSVFSVVNSQLRNHPKNLDKDINEYSDLLSIALEKLPPVNNDIVYRDVNNPDVGIEASMKYYSDRIGKKITCYDYMSSHKSKQRWSDDETGFQMIIETCENSNSKDLHNITFCQGEEEVLFRSGTKFIIKSVDIKNTTIYLTEVST